jgi:hypothetical protein
VATEYTSGPTIDVTVGSGKTTKCMVSAYLIGQTAGSMRGSTSKTVKKEKVCFLGRMDDAMKVHGRLASNTERALLSTDRELRRSESGSMANVFGGMMS